MTRLTLQAWCVHWCSRGSLCAVANCVLVGFEACSSGGSTASTVNLVKAGAGEVMDPSGEDTAVVLVNGCDVTNYVCA